ncbi:MAG TPA: hypothetical protein VFE32_04625 [Puia sp.]|nr:hypothetical protein [Puia sp.]
MKTILAFCLAVSSVVPCRGQRVLEISQLKVLMNSQSTNLDREYMVKGYLFSSSVPLLINNPGWIRKNGAMPDSVYIVLGGQWIEENKSRLSEYQGRLIQITGKISRQRERRYRDGERTPDFIPFGPPVIIAYPQ